MYQQCENINTMAEQLGREQLAQLVEELKANPALDVQHVIKPAHYFVDVWQKGTDTRAMQHLLFLSSIGLAVDEPLVQRMQDSIAQLRQLQHKYPVAANDADAGNVTPIQQGCVLALAEGSIDLLNPGAHTFNIETIAHHLSHLCRYNGATVNFYSVAQHSVLVSHQVPPAQALAALLHDAAEAYCGDVPSPLRKHLPEYNSIIERVERAIYQQLGLDYPLALDIHAADLVVLATEVRDLMPHAPEHWQKLSHIEPLAEPIVPVSAQAAKQLFLDRFAELLTQHTWQEQRA